MWEPNNFYFLFENDYGLSITAQRNATTTLCQELLLQLNEDDSSQLYMLRGKNYDDDDWKSLAGGHAWANDKFCSIKFYKMQHGKGTAKEFLPPGKHPVALGERSIRTFGKCCWKVVR